MFRKGFKLVIIGSVVHAGLIFSATSVSTEVSTLALTPVQPFELPDATGISSFIHEYAFSGAQKNNEETNNRRSLQGKFSSLNQILSQVTLKIPDPPTISQNGLDLTITELTCRELAIGDITLSHTDVSDISQLIGVTISGLQITCNFRWEYRFSFFNGRGDGKALLDNSSSAGITLDFRSDDYNILPPKYVTIPNEKCNSNIQIADMDFDGDGLGMIGGIIGLFKGLLTGTVEGELGKLVCEELVGLGDESLDDILEMLSSQIGTYLEPLASDVSDPLHTETNDLEVSIDEEGNALFVNFQELEEYAGEWVQKGLDQLDSLLGRGSNIIDNSALDSSKSPSSNELGINTFIRENLLNEEGSFIVDPSMITSLFSSENSDGVIFEGHDMLTETTMSISSIVVKGLDSFVELDLLNAIGNYTLRNVLKLEQLSFFVEIEAGIKASSLSSAVIAASNSEPITEMFTVDFTLKDIDIDLSILLGLNKEKLGKLELFSIIHTENILPCILSAVDTALFTGLSVAVSDMVPPTLSGFLDSGIDQIMSNGAVALFHMYENALIRAMPNFFQTFVREMLNEYIDNALTLVGKCPKNEVTMDGFVDFRDLFLEPADALSIGGLGDGKYGNLIPWVMDLVNDQLFSADEEGLLSMNDVMVRPLTKSQSGVEGSLRMNGTFVDLYKEATRDIWSAFADKLHLRLSDLRISGIDTFREPTKLLGPKSSSGYMLENQLSLGILDDFSISQKPVEASIQFELLVGGENSPLAMSNVIDLQLSLPSMDLLAVLYATVQESRLMQFPLEDVLNVDCWLSTIPTSKGMITDMAKRAASIDIGAAMNSLNMLIDGGMMAKTSCISCSNNMLEEFNSVLSFFIENDWVNNIQSRAISIATNMLQDEWAQDMIDREIEAASRRCPHDPNFGNIVSNEAYSSFQATREIVDGALYAGMSLVQMMAIVMAQKHVDMDIPLPSDFALDIPKSAKLIDFTDLTSIAGWADMVLDEARGYLGGMVESGDGKQVPGIATLLQSLVLDDGGRLTIPIVDEGFDAGGVVLSLYNVTLIGLDSFTEFNVLNTTSPQQFNNKVRLETLGCSVQMGLSVKDSSSKQARMLLERGLNVDELETITISLVFKDVEIDASIFLAMDQNLISSLKLGSILNVNHIFYCMLSTIHAVGVSQFMMQVGDINEFSISGFLSEETTNDIEDITAAVFAEYKTLILEAFPAFTSNTIRPLLHNILQVLMDRGKGGMFCPEPDTSLNGLIDFRDLFLSQAKAAELLGRGTSPYGDLFRMIYSFIEESTSAINEFGLSEINDVLVSKFTENHSNVTGDLYFPGELFGQEIDIALNGLNAAVEIAVKDVRIQSLDSIGAPIKLFEPINGESSLLNNSASIGVGPEELQASFTLFISGEGDDLKVSNELELGLSLKSVSMVVELLAEIEEMPFMNFPLQDVLNLNCWLATVVTPVLDKYGIRVGESNNGVVLRKLALAVAEARLHMNCISCSSSTLLDMSTYFSSEAGVDDTTSVANMIFEYGANILQGPFVQSQLDKMLNEAASKCHHTESYNQNFPGLKYDELIATEDSEDKFGFLIAIISVVAVSVVLSAVISLLVTFLQNRRHRQFVATLTRSQILQLEREQKAEIERQKDLNERMNPLICSSEVNVFIRFFMPIVILGNIALFLSGHLSLGGTVNLSGSFAGQDFDVEGFFEFSMAKSTIEMWEAGAKALAILIVLFSGVWPYTKQLISLVMWVVPPKRLSSGKRGKILHWLDVLGKWSMVDVFVLLTTLASFRISVESPDHLAFLPEGLYSIQMLVRPLWGLYANMLAQLVSQISSHIIIHYHRKTIRAAIRSQEIEWNLSSSASENTQPETLRKHNFKLDYEASSKRAVARKWVDWVLLVTLISFLIIVVCGCSLPSFGIEVLGLLGLAVESGNEFQEAKVYYSVFGLVKMIMDEAAYLNTASDLVGLGTLSALLVVTVFLVPLAQGASLLVQWFAPITAKQREWNATLNEILSAWQYMEVYVLSIIIAAWQLGAVSEYMINAYCEKLTPIFTTLSFYGILDKNDAQCFRVDATVETASWLLVAASILLSLLSHFIVSASTQKVKDQHILSERRLHSDRWLATKESTLAASVDISTSNEESEDYEQTLNSRRTGISRIAPRFTDYYSFATMRAEQNQTSVSSQDGAIEVGLSATIEEDNNANDLELWDL